MAKMTREEKLRYRWLRPFGLGVLLFVFALLALNSDNAGLLWALLIGAGVLAGYGLVRRALDRKQLGG